MGLFSSAKKVMLRPKTTVGPESLLKEFPLLYLYFDDFAELQEAASQGVLEIGMLRSLGGIGDYRMRDILAEQERFLDYYRKNMIRVRLPDGTMHDRREEEQYWDMAIHPEKHVRKPFSNPELEAVQKETDKEIDAIIDAVKKRYGM